MSDDETPDNVTPFPPERQPRKKGKGVQYVDPREGLPPKDPPTQPKVIGPLVPKQERYSLDYFERARGGMPDDMARGAARMRSMMIPYEEIAEFFGYPSVAHCRSAVAEFTGRGTRPEDLEVLRTNIVDGLESQARRSLAYAAADYFEDSEGNRIPNRERMSWHAEARKDLEVLAKVSGAQAAATVHLVTPESAELDRIVRELEARSGRALNEPEVLVLDTFDADVVDDDDAER